MRFLRRNFFYIIYVIAWTWQYVCSSVLFLSFLIEVFSFAKRLRSVACYWMPFGQIILVKRCCRCCCCCWCCYFCSSAMDKQWALVKCWSGAVTRPKKTHRKKSRYWNGFTCSKVFLVSYRSIMRYLLFFHPFYFASPWLVLTHGLCFSLPSTAISLYIDFTIIDKIDR